jgi:UDP-N-acetylmuramoylalanine--D-glutamate ligase
MTTMTAMTARPIDPDALTLADVRAGALVGRPITVLGFARSGVSLARFFADAGATVTVYDRRPAAELGPTIDALEGRPIRLLGGPEFDPAEAWRGAALVTTSPSITPDYPTTEPRLRAALRDLVAARAAGDPAVPALVSEPDLFLRLCPASTVGVTGTKGKTTTASLAAALLAADPVHSVVLGGNIGRPLVDLLPELTADDRVVIELSELQLPTLSRGTTVAVYTNVTSDHLDRHGSVAAYRATKRRLAELVDPDGALVLNADDPVVASYAALGVAPTVLYRLERPLPGGVGIVDDWIVAAALERLPLAGGGGAAVGPAGRLLPIGELALPGRHNLSNALAAVSVALLFGVAPDAIRRAAASFTGVEHRLEPVAEIDGVRFINDSQGTQPDAVIAALRAFDPPVVLIAGGRDKGIDLSALGPVVAERAAAAVLIGESGQLLEGLFAASGLRWIERAASLEEAVRRGDEIARALLAGTADAAAGAAPRSGPATVLLSPAAASFDMFVDYAARGRSFKAVVGRLAAERAGGHQRGRRPEEPRS